MQRLWHLFQEVDSDEDGVLSVHELKKYFMHVRRPDLWAMAASIFHSMDKVCVCGGGGGAHEVQGVMYMNLVVMWPVPCGLYPMACTMWPVPYDLWPVPYATACRLMTQPSCGL